MSSGTLHIEVHQAKFSHNTRIFGEMDPFLLIKAKSFSEQTDPIIDGGINPIWNRKFEIPSMDPSDIIEFQVWDHTPFKESNDLIGEGQEKVSILMSKKPPILRLTYKKEKKAAGRLDITTTFIPDQRNTASMLKKTQNEENKDNYNQEDVFYDIEEHKGSEIANIEAEDEEFNIQMAIALTNSEDIQKPEEFKEGFFHPEQNSNENNEIFFEKKETLLGWEEMNQLYMKSQLSRPLKGKIDKIIISGDSTDLGLAVQMNKSSSWIEVVILNKNNEDESRRITIFENPKSNYQNWNKTIKDDDFLKELERKSDNQIGVFARAIGIGNTCDIQRCKIEVYFKGFVQGNPRYMLFERNELLPGSENMNEMYLITNNNEKILEVNEIEIEGFTKDQGFAAVAGSFSWIEVDVVNENHQVLTGRHIVYENYKLRDFTFWKKKIIEPELLEALTWPGAQLAVYARSQYSSWICEVKGIAVTITCQVEIN